MQYGVGPVAQTYLLCYLGGVYVVDSYVVLCKVSFHLIGQMFGKFLSCPYGIEQECAVFPQSSCHIIHAQVGLYVTCHEVGGVDEVCGAYGMIAETEVRAGESARLLGVVCKVCLAVFVGVVANDFHRVLVGSHRTVCSEPVEFGFEHACIVQLYFFFLGQRGECHIVFNAQSEQVFRHWQREVLVH